MLQRSSHIPMLMEREAITVRVRARDSSAIGYKLGSRSYQFVL
jgi:tRNA threonylcarbamoyladenosine modification (KEOPS) complex  Pcc1 subunit